MSVGIGTEQFRLRRDVTCYYVYEGTSAITLYRPIMFLYFLSLGLSWTEIAILEATGSLVRVLTEMPTGYVADRLGRRKSMFIGTVMITGALFMIGLASSFTLLLLAYPFWSLGWNFRNGIDEAWLYDRLDDVGKADAFATIRGRGKAVASGVGVLAAILGGILGWVNLAWPFLAASGLTAIGLPAVFFMQESAGESRRTRPSGRQALGVLTQTLRDPRLIPFVLHYFVIFTSVVAIVFMFEQPMIEDLTTTVGMEAYATLLLGIFYACIHLVAALLSYHTGWIGARIGLVNWFLGVPILAGGGLVLLSIAPVLAIPAIILTRGVADVSRTLAAQFVNDQVDSVARATIMSTLILVSSLAAIPAQLGAGRLADAGFGTVDIFMLAGVALLIGTLLLGRVVFSQLATYDRQPTPTE